MMIENKENRPQRNSSIELYRIIATFAVLVVHFNGWFLGDWPLPVYNISNPTLFRTGQLIISAVSIICVNMFVIISGFFGIKLKFRSIVKLYIYLFLIYIPEYMVKCISTHEFIFVEFFERCLVFSFAGYFIKCYFMLMILSPVLNSFIDKYGKASLKWVLLFWFLEFWFACITDAKELAYNKGYSLIHFVLMYMIARCIKLYEDEIKKIKQWFWLLGYLFSTLVIIISHVMGIRWCWDYSSPVVVFSSICSFLPFLYKTFYCKVINLIASGTFAVYILHVRYHFRTFLGMLDVEILGNNSYPIYLIIISVVIIITFMVSVIYGIVCNLISNRVANKISKFEICKPFSK